MDRITQLTEQISKLTAELCVLNIEYMRANPGYLSPEFRALYPHVNNSLKMLGTIVKLIDHYETKGVMSNVDVCKKIDL